MKISDSATRIVNETPTIRSPTSFSLMVILYGSPDLISPKYTITPSIRKKGITKTPRFFASWPRKSSSTSESPIGIKSWMHASVIASFFGRYGLNLVGFNLNLTPLFCVISSIFSAYPTIT